MTPMRKRDNKPERQEFEQNILDLARVTRVTEGGKHLSFRACVILGDKNGRVGFGLAKGKDVQLGVEKAVRQAKKKIINVPIVNDTIPHPVYMKFKSAIVMMKPAPRGSGIIAGGPLRVILELAGVQNVSAKILSRTKNKITLVKAAFGALQSFKKEALVKKPVVIKAPVTVAAPVVAVEVKKNVEVKPAEVKKEVVLEKPVEKKTRAKKVVKKEEAAQ